jgi:protein ImuB
VAAVTVEAGASGIRPGMSAAEASARRPGLVVRPRDLAAERAAAAALLEAAWTVTPRVATPRPGELWLDLGGLRALWGRESRIAQRLVDAATALGLPARVGVAATRATAGLAARARPGITVVPPGGERAFLAPLPVGLLEPAPALAAALDRWGIRTLGALAALPRAALLARLGPDGARLQAEALGEDTRPFVPVAPPEPCVEALALDWAVTALDGLAFVLGRLLDRLEARLALRGLGAAALGLTLGLAGGGRQTQRLALPAPCREARTLLRLLLARLEGVRLTEAVTAVAVEAETAPLDPGQGELFGPPRPSPRELGETLGRLVALVGADRVGAPALLDTHRPDALATAPFGEAPAARGRRRRPPVGSPPAPGDAAAPARPLPAVTGAALVCRRLVPPRAATVEVAGDRPARVEADGIQGPVVACAGPWRTSGAWWAATAWDREEWDVALGDGAAYRLARDRATGAWTVDAVYD